MNEATARIKINKLLEVAGWRFFAEGDSPANICLEPNVTIKAPDLDSLGNDFEKTSPGFIDFLLLDAKGFPLIVLEAKSEDKNPLVGKEQARKYARSQNCRFVILSNGNLHYFWDLERGNPYVITSFPKLCGVGLHPNQGLRGFRPKGSLGAELSRTGGLLGIRASHVQSGKAL